MKWPKRTPKQAAYSLVWIKTGAESFSGVMPGESPRLRKMLQHVKEHQCGGVILPTEKFGDRVIEGEEIVDFTVAPYDGPHWWEDA